MATVGSSVVHTASLAGRMLPCPSTTLASTSTLSATGTTAAVRDSRSSAGPLRSELVGSSKHPAMATLATMAVAIRTL